MAKLTIGGREVTVGDEIFNLSPEDRQNTIDEIAASMGDQAVPPATGPTPGATYQSSAADQALRDQPAPNVPIPLQGLGAGTAEAVFGLPDLAAAAANLPLQGYSAASDLLGGGGGTQFRFPSPSAIVKGFSSDIASKAGAVTTPYEEMSWEDKLKYNVPRFGAQVASTAPIFAKLGALRNADVLAGKTAPKFYDPIVKPYAGEAPVRTGVADLLASLGTAGGVTLADQYAPNNPLAGWVGAMGGGASGSVLSTLAFGLPRAVGLALRSTIGNTIPDKTRELFNLPTNARIPYDPNVPFAEQSPVTNRVAGIASEIMQNEATDIPSAQRQRTQNISEIQPSMPVLPTTGALSEDAGLLRLENELRQRNRPQFNEAQRLLNTGARDTLETVAPPGASTVDLINRGQTEKQNLLLDVQRQIETAERGQRRVEAVRQAQAQDLRPGVVDPRVPASTALHREIVDQSLDPMTAEKSQRFAAVPNAAVQPDPLVAAAENIRAGSMPGPIGARRTPNEWLAQIETLVTRDPETGNIISVDPTRFQDLNQLRAEISAEITNARRSGASPGLLDNLESIRQGINQITETFPPAQGAVTHYRDVFAPVWGNENPTAREFRRQFQMESAQESRVPPSETAGKFIKPNAPETTAELQRIINSMPNPAEAQNAARDYLMGDLAAKGALDREGRLAPRAIEKWAAANRANLDLVPGLRDQIDTMLGQARKGQVVAGRMADEIRSAQVSKGITEEQINKGALGAITGDPLDADKVVHRIMSDPTGSGTKLEELVRLTADDPRARAGLKKAVQDFILDRASTSATEKMAPGDKRGAVSFANLDRVLKEHEPQLAAIYSGDEMNALRAVHNSLRLAKGGIVGAGSTEAVLNLFQNPVEAFRGTPIGRGIEGVMRLKFGALTAGGKFAGARRLLGGVGQEEAKAVEALLVRASLEPDVANKLLGREFHPGSPRWNKEMTKLLALGEAARDVSAPGEE